MKRMMALGPICGSLLMLLALGHPAQSDEYKLAVGDSLTLFISGINLERKLNIGLDGTINIPLIGAIKAEGLPVSELADQLRVKLPEKSYTLRTPEGRDAITVIAADEIGLYISDYRPVYISGDVAKPGEQSFRPGMSARQAVALAGGYDIVRFRIENPAFTTYDLLSEYQTAWLDRTRALARAGWLAKALGQSSEVGSSLVAKDLLSEKAKAEIGRTEAVLLDAKTANHRAAEDAAQKLIKNARNYISTLELQLKTEQENAKVDNDENERIADLFRRGTVPATRVAEIRRMSLLSATRVVQVAAQLEVARRSLLDAERDLTKLQNERRSDLLTSVQEAADELRKLGPRIDAIWEKLRYVTALRSQLVEGGNGGERQLSLVRRQGGTSRSVAIDEDVLLEPGDVIEVRLRINYTDGNEISVR